MQCIAESAHCEHQIYDIDEKLDLVLAEASKLKNEIESQFLEEKLYEEALKNISSLFLKGHHPIFDNGLQSEVKKMLKAHCEHERESSI
jgi:hypothetical protein